MAKYKLVPELDGIEIYFDEKPNADIRRRLVNNRWRWNGPKSCWYTKYSKQAEKLAKELCDKASDDFISKPVLSIKTVGNSVLFEQKSNIFTTKVYIKKEGNTYTWSSTNNQIACADCNRFFSIHARACIFCGCPIIHTIEMHYNNQILRKMQELQKQAKEREARRQQEELEYKKSAIKNFNKQPSIYIYEKNESLLMGLPIDKFKKVEERSKYLLKNKDQLPWLTTDVWINVVQLNDSEFEKKIVALKEERRKRIELAEIRAEQARREEEIYYNQCTKFGIPSNTAMKLWNSKIPLDEVKERIYTIDYYAARYPYMGLGHGGYVLLTIAELNNYVKQHIKR